MIGILHDLTYEENYQDLVKNLTKTSFSGPYLEFFQWISSVISYDLTFQSPMILTQLRSQRKSISKLFLNHTNTDEKHEILSFFQNFNDEEVLKQWIGEEKHTNEMLWWIAARVFQDLEEFFIYVSSKENLNIDTEGVYHKLCLVFNN